METHFDSLPGPCVLKPAVGFFSLGVYSIENARQWRAARDDIAAGAVRWRKEYPAAVLDNQVWLLESLIQGTEYAVDVYFNSRGEAVICNILQHDFASSEDVSDRLYYTSADIIRRMAGPLEAWFDRLNERLGLRDYPVQWNCAATPTAIWCPSSSTRCASRAGAARTSASSPGASPPTAAIWTTGARTGTVSCPATRTGSTPSSCSTSPPPARRYGASTTTPLCARFHKVLRLRRGFYDRYSHFGFLFTETPAHDRAELDAIVRDDLLGFVIPEDHGETPRAR